MCIGNRRTEGGRLFIVLAGSNLIHHNQVTREPFIANSHKNMSQYDYPKCEKIRNGKKQKLDGADIDHDSYVGSI